MKLLLDTNVLILFLVGKASRGFIDKHMRTSGFIARDYDLLLDWMGKVDAYITLPHVLTETSNLLQKHSGPIRDEPNRLLKVFIESARELRPSSVTGAVLHSYPRLGLTDSMIISILNDDISILTSDLKLYLELARKGASVTNFSHLIEASS